MKRTTIVKNGIRTITIEHDGIFKEKWVYDSEKNLIEYKTPISHTRVSPGESIFGSGSSDFGRTYK